MPGYFSEVKYEGGLSGDFVEIVVPRGTDTSGYTLVIYDTDGTVEGTVSLGAVDVTLAHNDGYVLDDSDAGFVDIRDNSALALVDENGNVVQFLGFKTAVTATEGPANGQTSDITGDITNNGESVQSSDGGASYSATATPNAGTIPCFAPGTLIDTPEGPRPVADLRPGDLVETVDHGPMPVMWVRQGDHALEGDGDKPVLIRASAFAPGCPAHDLVVSPQHRILVGGMGQLASGFAGQVLVPAKALAGLPGIRRMRGKRRITWVHFALSRHAVVRANGCATESLLLGRMVLSGISGLQRMLLAELYSNATGPALNGPPARTCVGLRRARRMLEASTAVSMAT